MRILFINSPYYGHIVLTIGLVKELIKLGCHDTYLLPFECEFYFHGSGVTFCGY